MEENNSHHHGKKKKPFSNQIPSSYSNSDKNHYQSLQESRSGNVIDRTRPEKQGRPSKSATPSNDKLKKSTSTVSRSSEYGYHRDTEDTTAPLQSSESSQNKIKDDDSKSKSTKKSRTKNDVQAKKYASLDRKAKLPEQDLFEQYRQFHDDSVIKRTDQNEWRQLENNKSSTKLQRSKSTDISNLRIKNKSSRNSEFKNEMLEFDDIKQDKLPKEDHVPKVHSNNKGKSAVSDTSQISSNDVPDFRSFPRHKKVRSVSHSQRSSAYTVPGDVEDSLHLDIDDTNTSNDVSIDMARILPKTADDTDSNFEFPTLQGYRRHGLKHSFPSKPFVRIKRFRNENICSEFLGLLLFSFFAFIIFCPMAALFIVIIPIMFLFKKLCSCCCCCGNSCECGHLLTNSEKIWYDNCPSAVYQSVIFLEYGLSTTRIRDIIHARLVSACDKNGYKLYPKFTRKIQSSCKGPAWVHDNGFFINNHVYNMPSSIENMEDLQDYIAKMASQPITMDHPLWEIQTLNNFGDQRDTVILFRIHPCVYDGVSLVYILYKSLVDMDTVTTKTPKFYKKNICLNNIKAFVAGTLLFFQKLLFSKKDFNMLHGQHVHLSGKKVVSWSEGFSLEDACRIRQVTRSSLNDVLLSVAAGCVRKCFCSNGIPNPYDIHTVIPVFYTSGNSVYMLDSNQFLLMTIPLPTNTEGAIPRLWKMKQIMKKIHHQAIFSVTRGAMSLTSCMLPLRLHYKLWNYIHNKSTCIVSNVPGPEVNLTFASRQIKSIIPWMPPLQQVAVSLTFFTYGNQIRLSVMTDQSVLPNPELLTNEFIDQMQNLSELLANRRLPGEVLSQKLEALQHDCEIHAEPTVEQLQVKMSMIQQEVHDLKIQLEAEGRHKFSDGETKLMKKIEGLKEQFRELVVEMRQRKAAESENAMILSDDDPEFDDETDDGEPRRPFRRRTLSISSRMSTASVASTVRPLAAVPTVPTDLPIDFDNISQTSSRPDGITPVGGRPQRRPHQDGFQILDYSYSPSLERRFRTF